MSPHRVMEKFKERYEVYFDSKRKNTSAREMAQQFRVLPALLEDLC